MSSAAERITAEWEAANRLPPGEREQACDIVLIKYGPAIRAMLRDQAIAASPNVVALADRHRPALQLVCDPQPPSAA